MKMRLQILAMTLIVAATATLAQESESPKLKFDIPAQSMSDSLNEIADQSNLRIIYFSADTQHLSAPAVNGTFTAETALQAVLANSGLWYLFKDDRTVQVRTRSSIETKNEGAMLIAAPQLIGTMSDQKSSETISLSQAMQRGAEGSTTDSDRGSDPESQSGIQLEEVLVTGSRLRKTAPEGAQLVKIYDRERIERSGQTNINGFLNTLPEVSVSMNLFGVRTISGGSTVQLHGLPIGTTLVLINGRRVQTSGGQGSPNIFDLNSVPLAAVERVEVVSGGSSAVYGSDAIAGVVNILLKQDFSGLQAGLKYGQADGTDEKSAQLAWGRHWSKGSISIVGSYETQSELHGFERALTSSGDFRPYGGSDSRFPFFCNPGNVFSADGDPLPGLGGATFAAVPVGFTGTPTQATFAATAGELNTCSVIPFTSLIPKYKTSGAFAYGSFALTPSLEIFTELMFSHVQQVSNLYPPLLFGLPGFQAYTVSADNPFNPFGVRVGIGSNLSDLGRQRVDTPMVFVRPLVGIRGHLFDAWQWEIAGWSAQDRSRNAVNNQPNAVALQAAFDSADPNTALNPFTDGPFGSPELLRSLLDDDQLIETRGRKVAVNGFVRGALLQLPAGTVQTVLGAEFNQDELDSNLVNYLGNVNRRTIYDRDSYAIFGEARIPLLHGERSATVEEALAITAAGRFDHDQFFGSEITPQLGVEWRPAQSWLVRGTYGRAFKAPSLLRQFAPTGAGQALVVDPQNGNSLYFISNRSGGNPNIQPETGKSHTAGLVYSGNKVNGLHLSATHWSIDLDNSIQSIGAQTVINNENLFPGRIIRDTAGFITFVDSTTVNFGHIRVRGIDYQFNWMSQSAFGELHPALSVTQTYHYTTALLPGLPATDRVSKANIDYNFAPRWKGTLSLGWQRGSYTANWAGRYVGKYRDYDPLPNGTYQTLGDFWVWDANLRIAAAEFPQLNHDWWKGGYVELGGVNVFNNLPQFSNNEFAVAGYDGTQADIRGRFMYFRIGMQW